MKHPQAKMRQCTILDQSVFAVNAIVFKKFQALLDKPLPATDTLRRLLKTKSPWDK